jgi:hypothetical protein
LAVQQAPYRVLAGCDFTPLGNRAVIEAMRLCAAHSGAELHIISVAAEHARGLLLPGQRVEVVSHLEAQEYARQHVALLIEDYLAQGQRISLSRHGLERVLLGSVAEEVLRRAPCGVFVIRPRDFLDGERVPEIQPPLLPDEHALLPFRAPATYHYVPRASREQDRMMPAL